MKRLFSISVAFVFVIASLLLSGRFTTAQADPPTIFKFNSMVGIPAGLTGVQSQIPLRGITGGGLPWELTSASGSLKSDGNLKVEVTGLVLSTGPNAGNNPVANFRALVSCVRDDGSFANILTAAFPATTGPATSGGGNAEIETMVTLPQPCIAPIIFITNPAGSWFAATGK